MEYKDMQYKKTGQAYIREPTEEEIETAQQMRK